MSIEVKDLSYRYGPTVDLDGVSGRTDSGLATDLSTAHGAHIKSTSGETNSYAFACDECHAATIIGTPHDPWALAAADLADKREHVDGRKDVVISTAYDGDANGGNNYAPSSCSDTYCHSLGTTATGPYPAPNDTALAWDTDTATCRCHSGDATTAPVIGVASGSATHAKHVANATVIGTNYECAVCHSATVSAGNNELITGLANPSTRSRTSPGRGSTPRTSARPAPPPTATPRARPRRSRTSSATRPAGPRRRRSTARAATAGTRRPPSPRSP